MLLTLENFLPQRIQQKSQAHLSISSLLSTVFRQKTGAAAAASLCRQFWWFQPLFRPPPSCPEFPLLVAIMSNPSNHSKQLPPLSNSSLKWGLSQTLTCFILSFMVFFIYRARLDDQTDSYCAIFIEFGDVWSHGYLIESMIFMILHLFKCHCRKFWHL